MSRIHEALKRAEQERINQLTENPPDQPAQAVSAAAAAASSTSAPPLPMPSVFADQEAEGKTAHASDGPTLLDPAIRSDATPHLHGQQFIRFDDIWQVSSVPGWRPDSHASVFVEPGPASLAAEQFRTLRSRLNQIRDRQPLKSVLVTSAVPSEGKTFVALNLAQSLARQQGCKVLLIDGDLRSPGLHSALGAPLAPGLSDYLRGAVSDTAVIQRGLGDLLCLIPAGNRVEDPLELLACGRMKSLLDKLVPLFDWVVIDSPPLLPVSDAVVLADSCDGVLSVVRSAFTDLDSAQKACHELQEKNLLGIVLNCADEVSIHAPYACYTATAPRPDFAAASPV